MFPNASAEEIQRQESFPSGFSQPAAAHQNPLQGEVQSINEEAVNANAALN